MGKSPTRQQDAVANSSHGNGNVTTGDTSVTFQGQPVACAGDTVKFADGTEGIIQEGNACVVVNGKRVALVGDQTSQGGVLQTGAASLASMGSAQPVEMDINGVQTNPEQLGKSVVKKSMRLKRPMTAGEIAMCQLIFKDAIDYSKVKIHKGGFMWGAGDNAMTPFGDPHFPVFEDGSGYQDDFSSVGKVGIKAWFIHEMLHVWQYQMGYGVASHGIWISLKGGYKNSAAYLYNYYSQDPATKKFSDFNMEQQDNIVAYYYAVEFLGSTDLTYTSSYPFNRVVLQDFLINPKDKNLLPHTTHF